jgi:hypothetical protein
MPLLLQACHANKHEPEHNQNDPQLSRPYAAIVPSPRLRNKPRSTCIPMRILLPEAETLWYALWLEERSP